MRASIDGMAGVHNHVKVFVDRQRHHCCDDEDYPHPHPHHHPHHHSQQPVKESLPSQDREREEEIGSRRREGSWDGSTCNLHLPRDRSWYLTILSAANKKDLTENTEN